MQLTIRPPSVHRSNNAKTRSARFVVVSRAGRILTSLLDARWPRRADRPRSTRRPCSLACAAPPATAPRPRPRATASRAGRSGRSARTSGAAMVPASLPFLGAGSAALGPHNPSRRRFATPALPASCRPHPAEVAFPGVRFPVVVPMPTAAGIYRLHRGRSAEVPRRPATA